MELSGFNIAVIVAFDIFVLWAFGPNALLYLFLSFWFSVGGLHPLSARWLQEHFAFGPDQGTFDYYGPLNTLALNIGYHNEHHDFHEIPWTRLPKLKAMAPEFYDTLGCHRSWVALLVTGEELLPPGAVPAGFRIVDSNSPMLAALAARDGGDCLPVRYLPDRHELVRNAIRDTDADVILVLEDGRVVGRGTHHELLETCETYREIVQSQLSAGEAAA